jgi:hypothetical protein
MKPKYSLFRLERTYHAPEGCVSIVEKCFEYIETYNTLKEALKARETETFKTLILPTYA